MSQSSAQAWTFYREVAESRVVWTVSDDVGYPAPKTETGERAQPFWSSRSRVEKIIQSVRDYSTFQPEAIAWEDFCQTWVPGLARDGLLAGVNWSGPRATGFDLEAAELQRYVEALIENPALTASGAAAR